jgi:hypothetical protein
MLIKFILSKIKSDIERSKMKVISFLVSRQNNSLEEIFKQNDFLLYLKNLAFYHKTIIVLENQLT